MKKIRLLPVLILLILNIFCEKGERLPDSNRLRQDHTPTPFSAEQIRETCVDGYQLVHRIEAKDKGVYLQTTGFTQGTLESTTMIGTYMDEESNPMGDPITETEKWTVLQAHASFPESKTTISREQYNSPAGEFDCWLYIVVDEEKNEEKKLWFTRSLPGPPICFEQRIKEELVYKMELLKVIKPR